MIGPILRTSALGLRLAAPLTLLALTDGAQMGVYYLFAAFYTLSVTISGIEASLYFSRRLLRHEQYPRRTKLLWWQFLQTVMSFGLITGMVAAAIAVMRFDLAPTMSIFLLFFLLAETLANETGRLMWLLGRAMHATRTDLARSLSLYLCLAGSAWATGRMLSSTFLLTMTLANMLVVLWHARIMRAVSVRAPANSASPRWRFRALIRTGRNCVLYSGPQFIYAQTIGLWVFVERELLDRTLGKNLLGSYALATAMITASTMIVAQPSLSRYRGRFLAIRHPTNNDRIGLFAACCRIILPMAAASSVAAYIAVPFLNEILDKTVELNWMLALAALLSAVASSLCGQIGIAYERRKILFITAAGATITLLLLAAAPPKHGMTNVTLALLSAHALCQLGLRRFWLRTPVIAAG